MSNCHILVITKLWREIKFDRVAKKKILMTLHTSSYTHFLYICNHDQSQKLQSQLQFPISYCNNIYLFVSLPISFRCIVGIERNLACAHAKYCLFASFLFCLSSFCLITYNIHFLRDFIFYFFLQSAHYTFFKWRKERDIFMFFAIVGNRIRIYKNVLVPASKYLHWKLFNLAANSNSSLRYT